MITYERIGIQPIPKIPMSNNAIGKMSLSKRLRNWLRPLVSREATLSTWISTGGIRDQHIWE